MSHDQPLFIGVDLGGTNIEAGIVCEDGKVLATHKKKTKAETGCAGVIDRIVETVEAAITEASVPRERMVALGIGAPGPVDPASGVLARAVNLGWGETPLAELLQKKLNIPVVADNDVNVGVWGEYRAGAGQGHASMAGIFIGTGIGGGMVLEGRMYRGHFCSAGEIGHTVICGEGGLGRRTLENLASRTAIVEQLRRLIQASHPSLLTELTNGNLTNIRSKVLAEAYDKDDPLVVQVVDDAAQLVGIAAANLVTLLSVPVVVLGGGLTDAMGKKWVGQVEKAFARHVFPHDLKGVAIVAAALGDQAGIIGAGLLARDRYVTV